MKGATQVISVMIITGIVIALIGVTYYWSKPLIDKRGASFQMDSVTDFAKKLDGKIVEMAKSCTGTCQDRISVPNGMSVRVIKDGAVPDNNSIIMTFVSGQKMMSSNTTIPLNTNNVEEIATYGDTHSVITVLQEGGSPYIIRMKIHYRELDTNSEPFLGYKIAIGGTTASSGNSEVVVRYINSGVSGTAGNGGPLNVVWMEIFTV